MQKIPLIFCSFLVLSFHAFANENSSQDTLHTYYLNEVVVTSSTKETNPAEKLPASISVLAGKQLDAMQVEDIKDVSSLVPNFFIPDYGAKMTSPVFIRGIGNRSAGQATSMYVDHVPYLNKSTFDFEFTDIQRIEILRGPQGTLFGRNSMGGVINIFTPSSLQQQGTKIGLTTGNYSLFKAKASNQTKLNDRLGISVGAFYNKSDGFFTNQYTGKKADASKNAGGKVRLDFKLSDALSGAYILNYDYVDQDAFPYGLYNKTTGKTQDPNFNGESSYNRNFLGNILNLSYTTNRFTLSSATSYQIMKDDMMMDQDYRPDSIFTLNQKQNQKSVTQEFAIKSNTTDNYQWSFGVFGFNNDLTTDATVDMQKEQVASLAATLQPIFDELKQQYPSMPAMSVALDQNILNPGTYKTPGLGGAIFHQSTYNHLFLDGLSVTAGIRLDYEKDKLDYHSQTSMDLNIVFPKGSSRETMEDVLQGTESMKFIQILPKGSLKYDINTKNYVYASAAKGYNPGGYNVESFSYLMSQSMITKNIPGSVPPDVKAIAEYNPEFSWNYEIGYKGEPIKDILKAELTLFYVDIKDMQLTQFVEAGTGRMLKNVGDAVNKGVELSLSARILSGLYAGVNYGYTHAVFKDYSDGRNDYKDKYLPYVPQHTLSIYGSYTKSFRNKWIDRLNINAQYNAAGKIYWTETNDVAQDFYGLVNVKASITKKTIALNVWTKNLLDTGYNAFYFESFGNSFFQKGKPFTFGADLIVSF